MRCRGLKLSLKLGLKLSLPPPKFLACGDDNDNDDEDGLLLDETAAPPIPIGGSLLGAV